jgi:hypothetical protein
MIQNGVAPLKKCCERFGWLVLLAWKTRRKLSQKSTGKALPSFPVDADTLFQPELRISIQIGQRAINLMPRLVHQVPRSFPPVSVLPDI